MVLSPSAMDDLLLQTLVIYHWLEAKNNQETLDKLAAVLVIGSNEDRACNLNVGVKAEGSWDCG